MTAPPSLLDLHDRENVGTIPRFPYGRHRSADRLYKDLLRSLQKLIRESRIANHNHRRLCLPTIARPVPTHTYTLLPTPYVAGRFRRSSLRRSPPATRHTPYHKCCCLVAVGQHQSGHRRCIFRSSSTIRWEKDALALRIALEKEANILLAPYSDAFLHAVDALGCSNYSN
jgi:hypothetical protein